MARFSQRFAVIGDVHACFDAVDRDQLDSLGYDAVLFVGDLTGYVPGSGIATAKRIAKLTTPAFVHPGNHDATTLPQLVAEVFGSESMRHRFGGGQLRRVARLEGALGNQVLTGYSVHPLSPELSLVAARPHSFGGSTLGCARYLSEAFAVTTLEASTRRIVEVLDSAPTSDVIVVAHNGPHGLGARPHDIWGCDFDPKRGDFGDLDLAQALTRTTKSVRAVLAGHMHHRVKGSTEPRQWRVEQNGTLFLNAAAVPRIKKQPGGARRHHVRLTVEADRVLAEEVWLDGPDTRRP
ncbi:MAG: metallophosphoesterase [Myxococcota bacterium]